MMMADIRGLASNSKLDLQQILDEAKHRWLRPSEILEILKNYQLFQLSTQPPLRPPAGSLFLFDRKALRYFRKDGHRWRKKKDGKTVREAHEKLKAGSVDVLHCYYAHGEDNDNFQRRIYWMLDGNLEHIVLVHYREVNEVYRSRLLPDPGTPQSNSGPSVSRAASPVSIAQTSYGSSPNRIDWSAQSISSEFEDVDSRSGPGASSLACPNLDPMTNTTSLLASEVGGFPVSKSPLGSSLIPTSDQGTQPSLWSEVHGSGKCLFNLYDQKFYAVQSLGAGANLVTDKHTNATLDVESKVLDTVAPIDMLITNPASPATHQSMVQEHDFNMAPPLFHNLFSHQPAVATAQVEKKPKDESNDKKSAELKKLDSFSRWLDKEIGGDCQDSLMASDSRTYWNTLSASNQDREVSSLSCHMQLDVDSLGPSLSQEQLFSICDFSPDWAYSGVETKVLIIGIFLGSKELFTETKWGCMFGDIEVSAEVLSDNVIRCQAPLHATGRVPFYITCRNRLACSEVREFEFRENSPGIASLSVRSAKEEELHFQVRLAKLLNLSPERMGLSCPGCDRCIFRSNLNSIRSGDKKDPVRVGEKCPDPRDKVIQSLLEDRLCEWLMYKVHEGGKGPDALDDEGQGVIHLAAGLGYDLVLGLIVAASGNPNFRDSRGRTALHWASYFGREETVIELLRLGVDPTAVDDPTASSPGGQTAADIASSQGHKGLAGYLAEAFLSRHLSSLSSKQHVADSADADATIAAEHATEVAALVAVQSNEGVNEQLSLKGSLAAVRKSAHAAALIQAVYRAKSFRHRQLPKSTDVVSEISFDLATLGSLSTVQKRGHYEDYLHSAAVKIQQKYRGWKGRKEFLKIRNRIVKIQAHVRGHQVRKQYKKVVWSVGIVEKAILRWRRKGAGLRGFRIEKTIGGGQLGSEKSDEYEFLRISRRQKVAGVEKALERVKSMVRNPEARDQYMRLANRFETLEMSGEGSSEASSQIDR